MAKNKKLSKLNTRQILALVFELQSMNNAARELYKISQSEENMNNVNANYLHPACVLFAFSCELCLKAILAMLEIDITATHGLKELFDYLPKENQEKIRDNTYKNFKLKSTNTLDFNVELSIISNSFVELRYYYEYISSPVTKLINVYFLDSFCFALIQNFTEVANIYSKIQSTKELSTKLNELMIKINELTPIEP